MRPEPAGAQLSRAVRSRRAVKGIGPGGWWLQPGGMVHDNHCEAGAECVVFVYLPRGLDFIPAKTPGAKAAAK